MPLILPRRSLLSYPAGTAPGFDPSHPASRGLVMSAVPAGAQNFINLATGAPFGIVAAGTALTPGIDGIIGPFAKATTGGTVAQGVVTTRTISNFTIGAIFCLTVNTGAYQTVVVINGANHGFWMHNGNVDFYIETDHEPIGLTLGRYYFVGMSAALGGAGSPMNFVVRDLQSGQTRSASTTCSATPISLTNVIMCNDLSGELSNFPIAAGMLSDTFLSLQQLLDWSRDPFSFWYPPAPPAQRKVSYSYSYAPPTDSGVTTGGARVLQRFNKSKLAYPAGALPGIDRSHPAASQQLAMSVVSSGANFIDLVHGTLPAFGAGSTFPRPLIDGPLGPATRHSANTDKAVLFPGTVATPTSITFGAIITSKGIAGTGYNFLITNSGGYLFHLNSNNSGVHGGLAELDVYTAADNYSGILITPSIPYFVAYSGSLVSGGVGYFIATDLSTGKIQTSTVTIGSTFANNISTIYVGNDGSADNSYSNSNIAAAMCAPNLALSLPQMQAWSKAPWEFWFPNKTINLTSDVAVVTPPVTTGGARVSQRFNRSKLAYPAGALPGIDPTHPASKNLTISAVSAGNNFVDLRRGVWANSISVAGAAVDRTIGLATLFTPTVSYISFLVVPMPASPSGRTLAGIFRTSSGTDIQTVASLGNLADSFLYYQSDVSQVGWYDGAQHNVGLTVVTNQPYFLVASAKTSGVNFVLKNLATGQVQSAVFTGAIVLAALSTNDVTFGADYDGGGLDSMGGVMSAGMMNRTYMSMSELLKWADDPWAFWYPNKPLNLMSDGGVIVPPPTFLAAWARRSNPPVLGTGNF